MPKCNPTVVPNISSEPTSYAGTTVSIDENERWLPVPQYEGLYEVSDMGRVRSIDRTIIDSLGRPRRRQGKLLAIHANTRGYSHVTLFDVGRRQWPVCVHRLVLLAFVGPRPDGLETRHLNGDRLDARLENLVYGTHLENMADKIVHRQGFTASRVSSTRQSGDGECARGHVMTEENTYVRPADGRRDCRQCRRQSHRDSRARRALAVANV